MTVGFLQYSYASYTGSENANKKSFELKHQGIPIFKKIFNASSQSVVRINNNIIRIPNHFFVTGEEITYSYPDSDISNTNAIGIATTSIPGIGLTDKLPKTLYVVKLNESDIRVSASASESLKTRPVVLQITSLGIGTSHLFECKKQTERSLIDIDNVIQSPIVSSSTTSKLSSNVGEYDIEIFLDEPNNFYFGDLIKIKNEVMKIVSIGANSVIVDRALVGTSLSTYTSSEIVSKSFGNYNIVNNVLHFVSAPYGKSSIPNPLNKPDEVDYTGITTRSTFGGRVFLRSGITETNIDSYKNNYILDDISPEFDGIERRFKLTSNLQNVTDIFYDNAILLVNNVYQNHKNPNDYDMTEELGETYVTFTGNSTSIDYDVNTASIPRGGIILSIGSSSGFGYQPLITAGGTAVVSPSGTIQSVIIENNGSGYRRGIQSIVNVGVIEESDPENKIEIVGRANITNGRVTSVTITNAGSGYDQANPPKVVIEPPLSYSNIPLVYSSKSSPGVGTGAVVDIIVGQGSSVISFELKNLGYGYKPKEILTIPIGGTTGIPTTALPSFSNFEIVIDNVYSDNFSAWTVGNLVSIDSIEKYFNGVRKRFPIFINGNRTSILKRKGSLIDLQATLLVFINDIIQIPGKSYTFTGGSTIRFSEPPKEGDRCKIVFYSGTLEIDTQFVDILESIEVGDGVTIKSEETKLTQDERKVFDIISSDVIETNLYPGPGVTLNEDLSRPLTWCKLTEDTVVNGEQIGKDRIIYEPYIQPSTNIIQNVGIGTTIIFVENVKSFFDSKKEYIQDGTTERPQNKILIISQESLISAAATAIVSSAGTISSIIISDGGVGYSTNPSVMIASPVGFGTTAVENTAKASATVLNGVVTGIAVTFAGIGYTSSNPPEVLIEPPVLKSEIIDKVSYQGDFGIVCGIKTTTIGVGSTGLIFDLFIPQNSVIRDTSISKVGIASTGISGIQTGYYFVIKNSNIGGGTISIDSSNKVIGIGTTFIDNVYQAQSVSIAQTSVPGVGVTYVAKVTVRVSDHNNLNGIGFGNFYGEYSWGRISTPFRINPQQFESYHINGNIGISTSPIVQRFNRLKYLNYNT